MMIGKVFVAGVAGVAVYFISSVIPYVNAIPILSFWLGFGTLLAVGMYLFVK
jgi:hypothetical protein